MRHNLKLEKSNISVVFIFYIEYEIDCARPLLLGIACFGSRLVLTVLTGE